MQLLEQTREGSRPRSSEARNKAVPHGGALELAINGTKRQTFVGDRVRPDGDRWKSVTGQLREHRCLSDEGDVVAPSSGEARRLKQRLGMAPTTDERGDDLHALTLSTENDKPSPYAGPLGLVRG